MTTASSKKKNNNLIVYMQPLQRILLSLLVAVLVYLFIRGYRHTWELTAAICWVSFAASFVVISWITFFFMPVHDIVKRANKEDGSRPFVLGSILVSSFASLFTVLLLMISKDQSSGNETLTIVMGIAGMMLSWTMVHTIFTFHYAHLYYFEREDDTCHGEALEFPNEKKPDYLDFAYFSFVIGMTFQVSDVEINSRMVRRTALAHGLLAFAINTFVVALTINMIASLKN